MIHVFLLLSTSLVVNSSYIINKFINTTVENLETARGNLADTTYSQIFVANPVRFVQSTANFGLKNVS